MTDVAVFLLHPLRCPNQHRFQEGIDAGKAGQEDESKAVGSGQFVVVLVRVHKLTLPM